MRVPGRDYVIDQSDIYELIIDGMRERGLDDEIKELRREEFCDGGIVMPPALGYMEKYHIPLPGITVEMIRRSAAIDDGFYPSDVQWIIDYLESQPSTA